MNKTNDFKYNLPAYSDPVDIEDLNDNFRGIDDALMAGLCKKDYTGNNMGSSDPSARKYAWAPWFEIVNDNEFDVVVTDRNAPVESEEATINIAAGQTFRKYINGRYYMNFYVQDQYDVTFKWFTNAETYINESGGGGGGTGTVTSVSVQGGSGSHLTGSGNPIETSGTITINVDEGYSIPSDNEQTAWDRKAADLKFEINSSTFVITAQLKDSSGNLIGNERTIDLPLESVVVSGDYDEQTKKVILTLQNGSTIEFSVADLVSGLQTELNSNNKLNPDYIAYDVSHRAVSDTEKGTWNGKQNAISDLETIRSGAAAGATAVQPSAMQTALAGKQDSLDQTQLAAVNSGINSTKVAQIETNKTNVLYAVHKVGKNDFNFPVFAKECEVSNGTKVITDESIKLTATSADCFTIPEYNTNIKQYPKEALIPVNSGEKIVFSWVYTPHNSQTNDRVGIFGNGTYDQGKYLTAPANDGLLEYTVPSDVTYVTVRVGVATSGNSATYSEMMVSKKTAYDADPTYQMYSLPNHDLTRLEAEDRAALVEVVDSGAKNLLQNKAESKTQNNVTFTVNSIGEVSVSTTGAASANTTLSLTGAYIPNIFKGNIISGVPASTTSSTICMYVAYSSNGSSEAKAIYVNAATNPTHEILDYPYIQIFAFIYSGVTVSTALKFQPMICTLADWKVSQKFVPYRPDYDAIATRSGVITKLQAIGTDWTLIDLTFTGTAAYVYTLSAVVNASGNFPTGIAISTSNNASDFLSDRNLICKNDESPRTTRMMSCSALDVPYATTTYYVWAKLLTQSTNYVSLTYQRERR